MPTMPKHTTYMVKHLNIPVGELRLGADDDMSMLTTQETSEKFSVHNEYARRHTGNREKCTRFQ